MNSHELLSRYVEDLVQKERDGLQRSVDALAPILGEEDAKIAVQLDHDIRTAWKRALAEAGGNLIREKLREQSYARRLFVVSPLPDKEPE